MKWWMSRWVNGWEREIRMKKIILIAFAVFLLTNGVFAAEVKNLVSKQAGNRVVFEFDIVGEEKETDVSISLTINGKTYTAKDLHLEGDYGKVKVGRRKTIYWNVLRDFPRGHSGSLDVEILAGGASYTDPVTGMEFVYVKGGCFQMGDTFRNGDSDEKPVHEVCVDDFYIGKYEVTQGEWKEVMGNNPSRFDNCGDNCPVEDVSWNDIQKFIKKINRKTDGKYRLLTEAEWEYAARSGGEKEKWAGTSRESKLGEYAWYSSNSGRKTHPVGHKRPNGLGIYDMSGNVCEWVSDWYSPSYYMSSPKHNPKGPNSGPGRVLRGGSWGSGPGGIRAAVRDWFNPDLRNNFSVNGRSFRCAGTK